MSLDAIDRLLEDDERELKEKRRRLKAFNTRLAAAREANETLASSAVELLQAGDVSRTDLVHLFSLTTAERAMIFPRQTRSRKQVIDGEGTEDVSTKEVINDEF